jgi:Uma2 family endonuclease
MLLEIEKRKTRERKTYEDYAKLPDYPRYELIDGGFIMTPAPSLDHQGVSFELNTMLGLYLRKHKIGRAFAAPTDVIFDKWNVCQPDFIFVSNERASILSSAGVLGAPDLAIELLSPSTGYYDLTKKKDLYERFGVKEYWIIDPLEHSIDIFANRNGTFELIFSGRGNSEAMSEVLPGFTVEIEELFAR